ncbi:hypothetical protein Peur_031415 [Populus x canadensis]
MTSTAGTFCYSFGILLLQIITAKPPMGLTHHVERAIETGTFAEMLDPDVPNWPIKEAMKFTKLALRCAELRQKDRPDLGSVMLPELKRLRELAEVNMPNIMLGESTGSSPNHSQFSTVQDVIIQSNLQSGCDSPGSHTSTASYKGRR